ncbi:MAG: metalloregulator ArsR/SmtB family transcription factor [Pseudomonadales bacterium]|nr:metalloregulator ArsR/SmtB family transcription factor [Pseudomonadales bacterium]
MSVSALRQNSTEVEILSVLCKALGDPLRLEILRLLRNESFSVLEICRILSIRQSALSHHLKILANTGLLTTRREGNSIFYRRPMLLAKDRFHAFRKNCYELIDQTPLRVELKQGIAAIHRERSEQSLLFFTRHADQFREQQELITAYEDYEETLLELLNGLSLPGSLRVMEVGPGEGGLLARLAERFEQVTGLDNSLDMLNRARQTMTTSGNDNVSFIHGDTRTAIKHGLHSDLLIFNMVLHHIPSPREAFQDSATILDSGGLLLLIDLCHHDQDWVRDTCGDLWLGFDNEDLDSWARQAGLTPGQSMYLGLRNGFQILMRLFSKNTPVAHGPQLNKQSTTTP